MYLRFTRVFMAWAVPAPILALALFATVIYTRYGEGTVPAWLSVGGVVFVVGCACVSSWVGLDKAYRAVGYY